MTKTKNTLLSLLLLFVFVSCKKETIEGPQGPQGPAGENASASTGTISGTVKQYNTYLEPFNSNLNATTVSIVGTSFVTVTDTAGQFNFNQIPYGVYDINFYKSGAGIKKINQVVFPGTGNLYLNASIYDKPSYQFTGGAIIDTTLFSMPNCLVKLSFAAINKPRTAILIFGRSNTIDIALPQSYQLEYELNLDANQSSFQTNIGLTHPMFNVFSVGSIIYARIYPISNIHSTYYDYLLDKQVHTDYGTPLAGTFTLTKP